METVVVDPRSENREGREIKTEKWEKRMSGTRNVNEERRVREIKMQEGGRKRDKTSKKRKIEEREPNVEKRARQRKKRK